MSAGGEVASSTKRAPLSWKTYGIVLAWIATVALIGMMMSFRAARFSSIAQMIDMSDVPILHFMDQNYVTVFVFAITAALGFLVVGFLHLRASPPSGRSGIALVISLFAFLIIELIASRGAWHPETDELEIFPMGLADWLGVTFLVVASILISARLAWLMPEDEHAALRSADAAAPVPFWRLGIVYLIGCVCVAFFAFLDHFEFWDAQANGGYEYAPFFAEGEHRDLDLVLYSTSALFASLAALIGCGGYVALCFASRRGRAADLRFSRSDVVWQAGIVSFVWTFSATVPWMIKVAPEIGAGGGEIFPFVIISVHLAAIAPLAMVGLIFLKQDFEAIESGPDAADNAIAPRRSEYAFWATLLFLHYPIIRLFRQPKRSTQFALLTTLSGLFVVASTILVYKIESWFDFEDWRGMIKAGQLPFLRVLLSLFCGFFVYLVARRAFFRFGAGFAFASVSSFWRVAVARLVVLAGFATCIGFASSPFWAWGEVRRNVFARAFEFSNRHEFELLFLHWIFDADRDGYAAVLNGADPDDFDSDLVAGRITPSTVVHLPPDEFRTVDAEKAKTFPNVVVLFLEGVVPRAISAYGKRNLADGLVATPHLDSIARDGTIFTQARCFYPSTWDAWVSVATGRFLRVSEMRQDKVFGSKYSRYNNLYRTFESVGVDRWCHADCAPYYDLLVPVDLRSRQGATWQRDDDKYSTRVTSEEAKRGIWRGDKRNARILAFLDDVKPGERFFISEHMSDTHFPWERTSLERAQELGFPNGLEMYEADARLSTGATNKKISRYYQVITRVDAQIGQIVDKLKERGVYDDTMIVIVGDHGCQFWEHEHIYYVGHLYEQSLRLPLIIKIPGVEGGRMTHEPVLQLDILPTVMELAGVVHDEKATPEASPLPGRSLLPLMRDDATEEQLRSIRERDMILTTHYDTLGVLSRFEHKLIFDRPSGTYLLFDLVNDPGEMVNLADDEPELLEHMLEKLRDLTERHRGVVGHINDLPKGSSAKE